MNKKRYGTLIILIISFVLLLTACQESEVSLPIPEIVREEVRVALDILPTSFLPFRTELGIEQDLSSLLFDSLFTYNDDWSLSGQLVSDYSIEEEGLIYTFDLRSDVFFHDGEKLTAKDVVFSLQLAKESFSRAPFASVLQYVDHFETMDDQRFRIVMKQPQAQLLNALTIGILPERAYTKNPEAFAEQPIGSGPFVFAEAPVGGDIVFLAHANYWQGEPQIEKLVFQIIPKATERLLALEAGEVDLVLNGIMDEDRARLAENPQLVVAEAPSTTFEYLGFMLNSEPVDKLAVRQAFAYALDKDALAEAMQGYRTYVTLPPQHWAVGEDPGVNHFDEDVDEAMRLLREEKLSGGITMPLVTSHGRAQLAELVKEQLSRIGVELEIILMDSDELKEQMIAQNTLLFLHGWGNQIDPNQFTLFASSETPLAGANRIGYSNAQVDELLLQGRAETDMEERRAIYQQAWQIMIDEETIMVPLYTPRLICAYQKRVQNLHVSASPFGTLASLAQASVAHEGD